MALAEARAAADDAHRILRQGVDLFDARGTAQEAARAAARTMPTSAASAEAFFAAVAHTFKSDKTDRQ